MKVIDFESKKQGKDSKLHDDIIHALEEIKAKLEQDEDKAEAMVCFMKTSDGQYYNSVVVNYADIVEMVGLIDILKGTLVDAIGD